MANRAIKRYEVYNLDLDKAYVITLRQANKLFGKAEFNEMIQGYLPSVVVTPLRPEISAKYGK